MYGTKRLWAWVQLLLLVFTLSVASSASAERPPAWHSVEIVAAGDRGTTLALQARLLTWLDARDVRLGWSFRTSIEPRKVLATKLADDAVLARIWLDLRHPNRAMVYVVDTREERFLVRVLSVPDGYDEITRESLGNILESALDALLLGGEIGVSRASATTQVERELGTLDDPNRPNRPNRAVTATAPMQPQSRPESSTKMPDTQPPVRTTGLFDAVSIGARIDTLSGTDALRVAPQATTYVFGASPAVTAAFGWLSAGYTLPSTWSGTEAGVELHGPSVHLLGGLRRRSPSATWRAAAGVGIELLQVEPQSFTTDARPVDAFWIAAPLVSARLAFEPQVTDRWFLSFALGADLDLAGHHFDIAQGDTRSTVLEPWRVRPVALVALGFSVPRDPFSSPPLQP